MTLDARSAQRAPGEGVDVITRVHSDPAIVGTLGAGAAVVMVEASAVARRVVATGIVATTIYSSDCSATRSVQRPGLHWGPGGLLPCWRLGAAMSNPDVESRDQRLVGPLITSSDPSSVRAKPSSFRG